MAIMVHISKMTAAAPPCNTSLMFEKDSSTRSSKSVVPFEVASRSFKFSIKCLSKPLNFFDAAIRRYLRMLVEEHERKGHGGTREVGRATEKMKMVDEMFRRQRDVTWKWQKVKELY